MFPVPWPARAYDENHVKGAIHISFRRESEFRKIWDFLPTKKELEAAGSDENKIEECRKTFSDLALVSSNPPIRIYQKEARMLKEWCLDGQVSVVLQEAVAVLGELLNGFNENVYRSPGGSDKS
jgi:hypothetical protein